MRKNGKSTKSVNKAAKGKAKTLKPAAPKSAAKKTAAPEVTAPLGRRGQIREVANVKVFQKKLGSVADLLKALKLKKITRLRECSADRLAPRGPRVGLPSRRALIETVMSTATPAKPLRIRDVVELLTPLGVGAIGSCIAKLANGGDDGKGPKFLRRTDDGAYYALKNASRPAKGKPSKN